jgi:acetyltransferase
LSVGNEADVNETDLIPFLAADDSSRVIVLYREDVKDGPGFVYALREAVTRKPVLVLKAGRTASGQVATASHTGALAGVHAAFRAACLQTGAIETEGIEQLFNGALALAYQPLPVGDRVAILTNSGGPAALAADAFEAAGLSLARVSPETQEWLRGAVHRDVQVLGPVDLLGGADEHDYRKAADAVLADPAVDGVLAILVPQVLVDPVSVVQALAAAVAAQACPRKPLLLCLMGEASLEGARQAAHASEVPAYTFPEDAVAAFQVLWRRARWLGRTSAGAEKQTLTEDCARSGASDPHRGRHTERRLGPLQGASPAHRPHLLREAEGQRVMEADQARALLGAYGISVPREALATTSEEAATRGREIGFPVVLKLASPDILHKTEIAGVVLDVRDEVAARVGYETLITRAAVTRPEAELRGVLVQKMIFGGQEVIVGVKRDPTFGPLVMFGLGGVYVEALADVSFRLAPLTAADAWDMLDEVRSGKLLTGLRGKLPADRDALVNLIVQVGRLAASRSWN